MTTLQKLTQFLAPVRELITRFSLRSWFLVLLGPMLAWYTRYYLDVSLVWFGILSLPLAVSIVASLLDDFQKSPQKRPWIVPLVLWWVLLLMAVSIARVPKYALHDELLVTEAALDGMVSGNDPYAMDFRGTLLDMWSGNATRASWIQGHHPAATSYVYPPGHLVISLPVFLLTRGFFGWYDQRLVYAIAVAILFFSSWHMLQNSPVREPLLLAFTLNPFMIMNFYGLNELFMLLTLALTGYALARRQFAWAAVALGAAIAVKQPNWIAALFILPFLLTRAKEHGHSPLKLFLTVIVVVALIFLPFFLWSPVDFLQDTVGFFVQNSYPIAGEGMSRLLLEAGIVQPESAFPFWIFEVFVVLPLLALLFWWTNRNRSLRVVFLATAIGIALVGFFSRYFLPAHVYATILIIILAFLVGEAEHFPTPERTT